MNTEEELRKLIKKWRKRRDRLSIKTSNLKKNITVANNDYANISYGKFCEIEKCASELVAFIGIQKRAMLQKRWKKIF